MRFFSNEAKDNADERDPEDRDEAVQSEPVAVPQQRAGSPWQHGPEDNPERPPVHEPAPQPTAFGASTVGGAVAASAAAGPQDDRSRATDRTTDAASGVADDRTVPLGTAATGGATDNDADRTVPLGTAGSHRDAALDRPDGSTSPNISDESEISHSSGDDQRRSSDHDQRRSSDDDQRRSSDDDQRRSSDDEVAWAGPAAQPGRKDDDAAVDLALEDRGTFDDPKLADNGRTDADRTETDGTETDRTETDRTETHRTETHRTETETDQEPDGVEGDKTAAAVPTGPAPFFPTADTQALRERWRDIQLRFVDDPKGATGEAAGLVDEAVDKLTAALREQRGSLAKGTDDTEALRVELRSYRDILDRLLGL